MIKFYLYFRFVKPNHRLLDIGCGKGGDLQKYRESRVAYVLGLDIAEKSIADCHDRLAADKERALFPLNGDFYAVNCHEKNLRRTFRGFLAQRNPLFTHIRDKDPLKRYPFMSSTYSKFKMTGRQDSQFLFDSVSCQFSLHYAFKTEDQARCLLENVADSLFPGGYFIGTTMDGAMIVKKLKEKQAFLERRDRNRASSQAVNAANQSEYLTLETPISKLVFENGDFAPFGCKYRFALLDAIDDCPEYLVHFSVLASLADEYGLEARLCVNLADFYAQLIQSESPTSEEFKRRHQSKILQASEISRAEWDTIGYYLAFAFIKRKTN